MDTGVCGKLGVESGGHGFSLPDDDGVGAFPGEDFDAFADALDFRSADKDHFERRFIRIVGEAGQQLALANGAVDLASVGVAADADIEGAESGLRGIFHLGGEENGASTGAESGLDADELSELFESGFAEELEEGARFSAGNDEAVDLVELIRLFYEHDVSAEFFEPTTVSVEIALQSQDTNRHTLRSTEEHEKAPAR